MVHQVNITVQPVTVCPSPDPIRRLVGGVTQVSGHGPYQVNITVQPVTVCPSPYPIQRLVGGVTVSGHGPSG